MIISLDPNPQTSHAHQFSAGIDRAFGTWTVSAAAAYVRGPNQIGTIDYNPVPPDLGLGRRPEDVGGVAGTSASILHTSYAGTYRGLTLSARKRFDARTQLQASYVLSKAEDISADFQSAFLPQDNGRGDPNNPQGLPLGFDPNTERGPSGQDQRHRVVVSGWACRRRGWHSVVGHRDRRVGRAVQHLRGDRLEWRR